MAKTFDTDVLPDATGKDLGSSTQRWDCFLRDVDISGTVALAATSISTTGTTSANQLESTVAGGTPPLIVASSTKVPNLNADLLDGSDWATPASLGSATPAAVAATALSTTGTSTLGGNISFTNAAARNINFSSAAAVQRDLTVTGCASTASTAGAVNVTGGTTTSAGGVGGAVAVTGGAGNDTGAGGAVSILGGTPGVSGAGGAVLIDPGDGGTTSGTGGALTLRSGDGAGGNANAGSLTITSGTPNGTGDFGAIQIVHATSEACSAGGVAASNTTVVTVSANVTTDQSLMAFTVPAKTLNRGGRLCRVRGYGVYSTQAGQTPTLALKVKLGAVTLLTWTSAATAASQTNKPWSFDCDVVTATAGASGTVEAHGTALIQIGSGAAGADAAVHCDAVVAVSSAIDLTSSATLQITATFSTNTAPANSAVHRLMTVEVY